MNNPFRHNEGTITAELKRRIVFRKMRPARLAILRDSVRLYRDVVQAYNMVQRLKRLQGECRCEICVHHSVTPQ